VARPFFERKGFQVKPRETASLRGVQFRRYVMRGSNRAAQQGAALTAIPLRFIDAGEPGRWAACGKGHATFGAYR